MKKNILFLENHNKSLLTALEKSILSQNQSYISGDLKKDNSLISKLNNFEIIITEKENFNFLKTLQRPKSKIILIEQTPSDVFFRTIAPSDFDFLDHIIHWEADNLTNLFITIQKILKSEIFHTQHYLGKQNRSLKFEITHTNRQIYHEEISKFIKNFKLLNSTILSSLAICEEFLMNVTIHVFEFYKKNEKPITKPPTFEISFDGENVIISVVDYLGLLEKNIFFHYVKKIGILQEANSLFDDKASGAGIGFAKIFYHSKSLICNSICGEKTELIAIIPKAPMSKNFEKTHRSLHFFKSDLSH